MAKKLVVLNSVGNNANLSTIPNGTKDQLVVSDGNGGISFATVSFPSFINFGYSGSVSSQTSQLSALIEGSSNGLGLRVPFACTVTNLSAQFDCSANDGSIGLSAVLYKNNVTTNQNVTVTVASTGDIGGSYQLNTPISFNANDTLNIKFFHDRGGTTTSNHVFTVRIVMTIG